MRATVIDHVIVHGMTMAEAGLRVRPNLSRFTVATIIRAFRQHNRVERMPHRGVRVAIFTAAQETLIVDMVRGNNLIRLREIRDKVIADNVNFESIDDVSLATIDRVLRRQKTRMKQVYRVPFERNSTRHKDLRYEYVQGMESRNIVQGADPGPDSTGAKGKAVQVADRADGNGGDAETAQGANRAHGNGGDSGEGGLEAGRAEAGGIVDGEGGLGAAHDGDGAWPVAWKVAD
ncbi:uncharacterized protein LOC109195263 [Oreochromis niloticus]|uniref:uncharacterized protein LOC109195263 n=1 Tax=Oreochromis niloticus TaxID=8128 RepID=UPI000904E917|nr:uncharacterized protein LOC109195263 [Oreochromis niloticus]